MSLSKSIYQNPEQKEGSSCNFYFARNEEFQFFFDKNCTRENVKWHIQHKES